jgi:hypothetical protein
MWPVLLVTFATGLAFAQATDLPSAGGFEGALPAYWTMGSQPAGATLSWATDFSRSLGHSLKIVKPGVTSDSAAWISTNMVDVWDGTIPKNIDILVGAYVKTLGVNTAPATNDAKWWVAYDFYDTLGVLIGETKLPVNQTTATSTGFVADTNIAGQSTLPRDAFKVIVKFVAGKNATGTVWADDFVFYGRTTWGGQDWNTSVGVPTGWYYWLPPNGGNDGLLANGFENTVVTNEAAHSGMNSLKFNLPAGRSVHDGYVGTQRFAFKDLGAGSSVNAGDWVRISVWIKASGLFPDSAAKYPGSWAVGFTPLYFAKVGNNDGYNTVGPGIDYTFAFPSVTNFDWTQYTLDVQLPAGVGAKYMETRIHIYNQFVGTIYFDDLSVTKIDLPQVAAVGGFEGTLPAFWTMGSQPAGATLSWATDFSRSLGHSLKIVKPAATSDSAAWISANMVDIWDGTIPKNVDILVGAYVKTVGVNTAPATNDAKWWVAYDFYDTLGVLIGETKLPVNQTIATSTGFVADTNIAGQSTLPKDAYKVIVKFVAGKNATGTVWADDFVFYGRTTWGGQDWNTSVGVPTGWYYWLPPNGGNDGLLANGFENTVVTTEAAHTGTHSLKFNLPAGRSVHDGYVATQRFAFSGGGWGTNGPTGTSASPSASGTRPFSVNALPGDWVRISVWIKASGLFPDSAAKYPGSWAVGFTPLYFAKAGNNDGYNTVGPGIDYTFAFPSVTNFDWTQYTLDVQLPAGVGAQFMEVRLHVYNQFVGTIYFDDLDVQKIDMPAVAAVGGFEGALPAYWTMASQPAGTTLSWATDQFRSLGHSLKIVKPAVTSDSAAWISANMCDIWDGTIPKNVDILVGAYVKTSGVNTAPATNDAKWWVAYDFYDTLGVLIGETKLPINQTTASTIFFVADTNIAGQSTLPRDAYKVIVKFVAGKNATGTVWADDFVFYGRTTWGGQDWNTSVGVPTGWYYWLPPNGGNDGLLANGFENTTVTTEAAHTGTHSLKFNLPAGRSVHDGYVGTQRFALNGTAFGPNGPSGNSLGTASNPFGVNAVAGDILELSVWIKASGLFPDSAAKYPGSWSVGFTPLYFAKVGNNDGYNTVGPGIDYTFQFPNATSFDWTQYKLNVTVPVGVGAQFMEVRLHVYNQFVGTLYFDDLNVRVAGTTLSVAPGANGLPKTFELTNNYPNPFNPSTTIQFGLPRNADVALVIFNVLGQRIRTLVDHEQRSAGRYSVVWDGRDDGGNSVGSGMYFYRLETGQVALVKKMLMLK